MAYFLSILLFLTAEFPFLKISCFTVIYNIIVNTPLKFSGGNCPFFRNVYHLLSWREAGCVCVCVHVRACTHASSKFHKNQKCKPEGSGRYFEGSGRYGEVMGNFSMPQKIQVRQLISISVVLAYTHTQKKHHAYIWVCCHCQHMLPMLYHLHWSPFHFSLNWRYWLLPLNPYITDSHCFAGLQADSLPSPCNAFSKNQK